MKRQWDIEELIEHFTLIEEDLPVLGIKTGATRLGCALLLKCFQYEGRFPLARNDIPKAIIDYIVRQLKLDAALFAQYDWEVYVNTLLIQQVLTDSKHLQQMKKEDLRALTPLIYAHITPYGTFRLDLSERIRSKKTFQLRSGCFHMSL